MQRRVMGKRQQIVVQEQRPTSRHVSAREPRVDRLELIFRKMALAAMTLMGIGHVLVNAPVVVLIGDSVLRIPIASQTNVMLIVGRALFLMALTISAFLGVLLIFGAVQFYERGKVKGVAFLGVVLGAFYLLCLGVGSTLLLPEPNPAALALVIAPMFVVAGAVLYISSSRHWRLFGSAAGIVGGVILAYSISNLRALDLVFTLGVPFTGPFLSLVLLESAVVILAPIAAMAHAIFSYNGEERLIPHAFTLLVALVYGLGTFIGSIILSMSFWNSIWQSPWTGPFRSLSDWAANMIVFWSASLVLMDIGGILLTAVACLGFVCISRELSKL
jgi:hypothetical protein